MAQHLPMQFLFAFIVTEYILSRRPSRVPWSSPLLGEMEIPKGIYLSPRNLHGYAHVAVMSPPDPLYFDNGKRMPYTRSWPNGGVQPGFPGGLWAFPHLFCRLMPWTCRPNKHKLLRTGYKVHRATAISQPFLSKQDQFLYCSRAICRLRLFINNDETQALFGSKKIPGEMRWIES